MCTSRSQARGGATDATRPSARTARDDGWVTEISDIPDESRYVITVDGQPAGLLDYSISGDVFVALHAEIDPAYGGRGLGSQLVTRVLDDVRASGRRLRPVCPFVQHVVEENSQYQDLVR